MELTQQEIDNRIEFVLDRVAESLIINENITPEIVNQSQRTIRNGLISLGRGNADRLVLNQKDIEANPQDLESEYGGLTLRGIVTDIPNINQITIDTSSWPFIYLSYVVGEGEPTTHEISALLQTIPLNQEGPYSNPVNVGQFINLLRKKTEVDIEQAKEYLDTNIFELLPTVSTRQQRIDDLFIELNNLLPSAPSDVQWGLQGDGRVDRDEDGNWVGSYQYYLDNSISAPQDNPNYEGPIIDEEDGLITRISNNASGLNQSKTIEDLRDRLNDYLKDVDEEPADLQDERPVYRNKSNGYIKFRNLNQGIIIRNTKQKYIEGLNPDSQEYLNTGFSITMWVRFLDKTSDGTLFNFGNPTRSENPFGFKLETLISGGKRYIKLSVKDIRGEGTNPIANKLYTSEMPNVASSGMEYHMLPENFNEWYFICATYNPEVDENGSDSSNSNIDYWNGNINSDGDMVHYSGLGNRCKLEFISRTDLLRARGYKTE